MKNEGIVCTYILVLKRGALGDKGGGILKFSWLFVNPNLNKKSFGICCVKSTKCMVKGYFFKYVDFLKIFLELPQIVDFLNIFLKTTKKPCMCSLQHYVLGDKNLVPWCYIWIFLYRTAKSKSSFVPVYPSSHVDL